MRRGSISGFCWLRKERRREREARERVGVSGKEKREYEPSTRTRRAPQSIERGTTAVALNYSRSVVTWNWRNDYD